MQISGLLPLAASALAVAAATGASASAITAWNTTNVVVPAVNPPDGVTGSSIIYDRDPNAPGAVTNGKIVFTPPEGVLPGIRVDNTAYTFGPANSSPTGCILASAPTTCDGPRQSGKRFKQVATSFGPIDLVFDVDPNGTQDPAGDVNVGYDVFHRLINGTGALADGFTISLGYGIGSGFTQSTAGDGLAFSTGIAFGDPLSSTSPPTTVTSSAFYPFGLFGDASTNPNFDLSGFFDDTMRSGFGLSQTEDMLASTGFYGAYPGLFGSWLPQSLVPEGALWDNDGDASTDALAMAWFDEAIGKWEIRRGIDPTDPTKAVTLAASVFVDTFADVQDFLGLTGTSALSLGLIEDLANLNVNFGITVADTFAGNQFTMRVQLQPTAVAPIPLPAALPLLGAALGGAALLRVRRKAGRQTV